MASQSLCRKLHWSVSVWISVVFLTTGFILNIVSFSAPNWNIQQPLNWGLWQMCSGTTGCKSISSDILTDVMQVGRVFLTIAFVSYICIIALLGLYLFWKSHLRFLAAAAVSSFVTLISLFVGALLWISSTNTSLSWCYYLCYTDALLVAVSGGIILHVRRQERLRLLDLEEQQRNV